MKLSLPHLVSILLPAVALGVVTLAAWAAGLRVQLALGTGGIAALLLSLLGSDWVSAFRSRNRYASKEDEDRFSLFVLGVYFAAFGLAVGAFAAVASLLPARNKDAPGLAPLLAFFLAGGTVFWLAHKFLSVRDPFRRGRAILGFRAAMKFIARWRDQALLQMPLGGLLLPAEAMTSHTAFVGAPESGKSLSIRLMMQKALMLIGLGLGHRALIYAAKRGGSDPFSHRLLKRGEGREEWFEKWLKK